MRRADALISPTTPKKNIFYITFGVKYRTKPHPMGVHPDGYVIIVAEDEARAREKAWELFGSSWAFIYDHLDIEKERFHPDRHPRGVLAVYYTEGMR